MLGRAAEAGFQGQGDSPSFFAMSGTLVNDSQVDLLGWGGTWGQEQGGTAWGSLVWLCSGAPSPRLSSREQLALSWAQSMQGQRLGRGQWWQCMTSHQGDTWSGKAEPGGPRLNFQGT